jgi:hypothetical protein
VPPPFPHFAQVIATGVGFGQGRRWKSLTTDRTGGS